MDFPADAVYGPNHNPASLSNWDGRDEYEDVVQIASRDDENGSGVEVTHVMSMPISPRSQLTTNGSGLWSKFTESQEEDDELVSPHIDTTLMEKEHQLHQNEGALLSPTSAASPSSANSLMMDLSDLEHSVNNDVSTVKGWMKKVKSERDRLRREKSTLNQQLTAERMSNNDRVSALQAELLLLKSKSETDAQKFTEELSKAAGEVAQERDDHDGVRMEVEGVRKQLESANNKVTALEGTLAKEKSSTTLREANKLEEARKEHFEQLSKTIVELEAKFEQDLNDMTEQKNSSLEEERVAHVKTSEELKAANSEKERGTKALDTKTRELETMTSEHDKCSLVLEESVASTKKELSAVKEELAKSQEDHTLAKEGLQAANTDFEDISSQLEDKSAENAELQKQLEEAKAGLIQEQDHAKEQIKKTCELNEATSKERDEAREEIKESQSIIEDLTKSNDGQCREITQLKVEAQKRHAEIDTLNEARKTFETYEEESKAEIKRLKDRLEVATSDILKSCRSSDSESSSKSGSKDMLAIPNLMDDHTNSSTEVDTLDESTELQGVRDELASMEKKCNGLLDDLGHIKRERDGLRTMVDGLKVLNKKNVAGNNEANIEEMDKNISELTDKLAKAEDAFVKAEVDKCEKISAIAQERDGMASLVEALTAQLNELKGSTARVTAEVGGRVKELQQENERLGLELASADTSTANDGKVQQLEEQVEQLSSELDLLKAADVSDITIVHEGKMSNLNEKLKTQLEEKEAMTSELTAIKKSTASAAVEQLKETLNIQVDAIAELEAEVANLKSTAVSAGKLENLQEKLDAHVKENERLSTELSSLRAIQRTADVESLRIQLGREMDELKVEHRIEVKMLKKEHASIKTKAKLISKEKDELVEAYEMERVSNNELEKSLEEMCGLIEAERIAYGGKAKNFKALKKKFSSMRKKRVPIDCAYKATRILLDQLEEERSKRSNDGQDVNKAIKLIEGLTEALDKPDAAESSLGSISETFSSDNKQMEDLTSKCEHLEIKCRAMKMQMKSYSDMNADLKRNIDHLGETTSVDLQSMSSSKDQEADIEPLRQANKALKVKSKSLTKELVDSTRAFEETITSYETVIARVKSALSEKKMENESLKEALADKGSSSEEVDLLRKQLAESEAVVKMLEADKKKLKGEVERLKKDFSEVISSFEQELTLSCEASEAALQQKHEECEAAKAALCEKQGECNALAEQLAANDTIGTIQLRGELGGKESEKKQLELLVDTLKVANSEEVRKLQAEIDQLKSELDGATKSVERNTEIELSVHALQGELTSKEAEIEALQEGLDQLENTYDKETEKYQAEVAQSQSKLEEATEEKIERQTVVEQLQNKLDGAMLSLDDNMQFYEQLRSDCSSLKESKETAIDKIDELRTEISTLTEANEQLDEECTKLREDMVEITGTNGDLAVKFSSLTKDHEQLRHVSEEKEAAAELENEGLQSQIGSLNTENEIFLSRIEQNKKAMKFLEEELESIRKEVRATEEVRQNALQDAEEMKGKLQAATHEVGAVRGELEAVTSKLNDMVDHNGKQEDLIGNLREDLNMAVKTRQKAVSSVEATEEELLKATTKLDDMLTYSDKLKANHGEITANLKHQIANVQADAERLKKEQEEAAASHKKEMHKQMTSMNEVVQSLQNQIKSIEADKEEKRKMHEQEISSQQAVSAGISLYNFLIDSCDISPLLLFIV